MLFVSEIFYSIQGEGSLCGVPSVFIRLSGCNLRCRWCDTPYASWSPEGEQMTVENVVRQALDYGAHHVVLTGGEPMVAADAWKLADQLHAAGLHITIETAGTIPPRGIACDLASISPKLANSTPPAGMAQDSWIARHEQDRLQPLVLREWVNSYDYQFKFVVESSDDLPEIEQVVASLGVEVPPWRVHLMPEGRDTASLDGRAADIVSICKQRGYRYADRLQIRLFGNTRGT